MKLDFEQEKDAVHILQEEYIDNIVNSLDEKLKGNSPTLVSIDLFKKGAG